MAQIQVNKIQVQVDKAQESRRQVEEKEEARNWQRTQTLLMTLAVVVPAALALPALIDKDLAGWLIGWGSGYFSMLESFEYNTGAEFIVQIVLISFIVLLAILVVPSWRRRVYRWLSGRQKSHNSEVEQSNPRS